MLPGETPEYNVFINIFKRLSDKQPTNRNSLNPTLFYSQKNLKHHQKGRINFGLYENIVNSLRFYFEFTILFVVLPRSLIKISCRDYS